MNALTLRNLIVDRVRTVDMYARFVFVTLARYAYAPAFEAYPSQETLHDATDISTRHIRRALVELERRGFIKRVGFRRVDHIPRARVVVYRIVVEALVRLPKPSRDDRTGSPLVTADHRTPGPSVVRDHRTDVHGPPDQACIDHRTPSPAKRYRKKRSGKEPITRASASGVRAAVSSSFGESVKALAESWAIAIKKHRGEKPVVRAEELRAARKLLTTHDADAARALVESAVALSVHARVKGNASLIAIAADPAAFIGKATTTKKANGLKQHAPHERQAWQDEADS